MADSAPIRTSPPQANSHGLALPPRVPSPPYTLSHHSVPAPPPPLYIILIIIMPKVISNHTHTNSHIIFISSGS